MNKPEFNPSPEELALKAEEEKITPEIKTMNETLTKLGDYFLVCRDAWEGLGKKIKDDFPRALLYENTETFNDKAFLESAKKLHPVYLEYLQRVIKEDVEKLNTPDNKLSPEEIQKYHADLSATFMKRMEFFSRLRPPEKISIGGKTVAEYEELFREAEELFNVSAEAEFMMRKKTTTDKYDVFSTLPKSEKAILVRLLVQDLFGDDDLHTIEEIYKKSVELGLELCPAEVGPAYRLAYTEQPIDEYVRIAMKQISGSDGHPSVFCLECDSAGVALSREWARPDHPCASEFEFVFRLPSLHK